MAAAATGAIMGLSHRAEPLMMVEGSTLVRCLAGVEVRGAGMGRLHAVIPLLALLLLLLAACRFISAIRTFLFISIAFLR